MSSATQALVNGVVLAIYRQQFFASLVRGGHHQFTGGNQHFLVGKRDSLTELHCLVSSFKSHHTNRGGNHNVSTRMGANRKHAFAAMMNLRKFLNSLLAQPCREGICLLGIPHRHQFRLITHNLPHEFIQVAARGQRNHAKSGSQRIHYRQALAANRTGRTKNGNLLHEDSVPLI